MNRRRLLAVDLDLCALGGCAPVVQGAGKPPIGFSGPHLEREALVSFDGERLPMMIWPAQWSRGRWLSHCMALTVNAQGWPRHPNATIAVAGESMGGAVAVSAFASERPPEADRVVLLSPAVCGWSEQPNPNAVGLWLLAHLGPAVALQPPTSIANQYRCSDNEKILTQMDKDPNVINATRAGATYGLMNLMQHEREHW